MKSTIAAVSILLASSGAVFAAGDAEAGKAVFNKCQTCHAVIDADGNKLAGTGAKVGPNLFMIVGRPAASYEGFNYGDGILEAAGKGLVWNEAEIAEYVQDPTAFLDKFTGDTKAKSKMMFKLKNPDDAANVAAFLASLPQTPAAN